MKRKKKASKRNWLNSFNKNWLKGKWVFDPDSILHKPIIKVHTADFGYIPIAECTTKYLREAMHKNNLDVAWDDETDAATARLMCHSPLLINQLIHSYLFLQSESLRDVEFAERSDERRAKIRNIIASTLKMEEEEVQNIVEAEALQRNIETFEEAPIVRRKKK
jgi:hypothetical protein